MIVGKPARACARAFPDRATAKPKGADLRTKIMLLYLLLDLNKKLCKRY